MKYFNLFYLSVAAKHPLFGRFFDGRKPPLVVCGFSKVYLCAFTYLRLATHDVEGLPIATKKARAVSVSRFVATTKQAAELAEAKGFEPLYRLLGNRISSAGRYDHFDTLPQKTIDVYYAIVCTSELP